ncbi:C39 family peptidase [Luteimicrobium subarcticum]|uniref:Peptidase C39-like protein n=1 Tax=Luteimicrobium subarcticum TaxID=620910 RepID=A0A2M8WUQ2_9MICO|nr:C39 family peptidase [Luteimicrobium subarcticum]PJI94662.1 peptidase C39-like protein [Luteimicrobium subarcticum]
MKIRTVAIRAAAAAVGFALVAAPVAASAVTVTGDQGKSWGARSSAATHRLSTLKSVSSKGVPVSSGSSAGGLGALTSPCASASVAAGPGSVAAATTRVCYRPIPSQYSLVGSSSNPTKSAVALWQQQKTGYWCGPTSVAIASKYFHTNKTQAEVAAKIKTTTAGSDRLQVRNGMRWVAGSRGSQYEAISAPSATELKAIIRADIGGYHIPVVINTHEVKTHYNNHPNRDIGHFVIAVGYRNGGSTVTIVDPAAGLAGGYEKSAKTFDISVSDLSLRADDRGVVG